MATIMADLILKNNVSKFVRVIMLTTTIISILGYADFIIREKAIDLLYLLLILIVTWGTNGVIGIICIFEIMFVKITASYFDNTNKRFDANNWNVFLFAVYSIVCIFVARIKKILSK